MSREFNRYPPVPFLHEDRAVTDHIEHRDRIQTLNVDAALLAAELKRAIRGEVRFDDGSRALYATDASNYRQLPIGVVMPRDASDVIATVALARKFGAPILGRGAGTSLAGQCCNVAVVLDMSKYMHRIAEMNPAEKFARVEPGIVLDDLRREAEKHTLTFGPDPATHAQCTLGGMIGNNSCGVHSIMSGKTVDNIEELEVLTYDGVRMRVGATSEEELARIIAAGGRRGEIYAGMRAIRDKYAPLIRERFPRIPRRVSGYNLDELLPENGFHVARALVGTESTCVLVLEAKTKLVHSPPARSLLVLGYPTVYDAADDVPRVLEFGPIGLEGFDDLLVRDQQHKGLNPKGIALLPPGGGWLLVEFGGSTMEEATEKCRRLLASVDATTARLITDAQESRLMWAVRESGLGATAHVPGKPPMWEGWEDAAVAPQKLGGYLRDLRKLLERYGFGGDLYGHFGDGCVHTRTNFELTSAPGIAKFRAFLDEAADLVASYGGSFSGEHGDGQARAALLEKMFGPELIGAFREFKALWDPEGKMNPGKVVSPYMPDENLRLGAAYDPWTPKTHFAFAEDEGHIESRALALRRRRALPASRWRHDVPELSGDARGGAFDTRPRAAALRDVSGQRDSKLVAQRGGEGIARSLSRMQRLQRRLPDAGRHGHVQGGVSLALLRRPHPSDRRVHDGAHLLVGGSGVDHASDRERDDGTAADENARRCGEGAAHAALRIEDVPPAIPRSCRIAADQRSCSGPTRSTITSRPTRRWPRRKCSNAPAIASRFRRSVSAADVRCTTGDSSIARRSCCAKRSMR